MSGVGAHVWLTSRRSEKRTAHFPLNTVAAENLGWHLSVHISSHVYGENLFNLMCQVDTQTYLVLTFIPHGISTCTRQGFLFKEEVMEQGRNGAVKWPLVGLFDSTGCDIAGGPDDIGKDALRWADQHVHKVC